MKRILLLVLGGSTLLAVVTAAWGQPRPVPPTSKSPGYIDTRWQNNPYYYWMIHHHWPPVPPYPPRPVPPPIPPLPPLPPPHPFPPYPMPYPYPVYIPYPVTDRTGSTYVQNIYQPTTGGQPSATTAVLPQPQSNQAVVCVKLPTTAAIVWFDGHKTTTELSATRVFNTPELTPDKTYHYTVKAEWVRRGDNVREERSVTVTAGKTSVVDFTQPADKK